MAIKYYHGDVVEFPETSVALGTFDGLHTAHMKIIDTAVRYAEDKGIKSGVMMFDTIPANVTKGKDVPVLTAIEDRCAFLDGLDFVYIEKFNSDFSAMTPEEFVKYLKNTLRASAVSVGYNYCFGKNASGNSDTLKKLCHEIGIEVFVTEKTEMLGEAISSTRIREFVQNGKIEEANKLLGRYFSLSGYVEHGLQNGRKMGFPTANLKVDEYSVRPKEGVYGGFCVVNGKKARAVINVGNNPTFQGNKITIECHLLDFNDDIYDSRMSVQFVNYIRGEVRFDSPSELVTQIKKDIESVKEGICYE